jgi:hypothetical protein
MWQIEKTTKRCQDCTNAIEVGRNYFSALFHSLEPQTEKKPAVVEVFRLIRQDFCANCWEKRIASGEESPFSFWQTIIAKSLEPPKTPRQVLLDFFDNLFVELKTSAENTEGGAAKEEVDSSKELINLADDKLKSQVKYLFALILLRKRLLKLKESVSKNDMRFLVFERIANNKIYEIPEINITEQELVSLREEFSRLFEFRI